jgi:hypothetical protein
MASHSGGSMPAPASWRPRDLYHRRRSIRNRDGRLGWPVRADEHSSSRRCQAGLGTHPHLRARRQDSPERASLRTQRAARARDHGETGSQGRAGGSVLIQYSLFLVPWLNAVAGPLPDLRYASKPVLDSFASIVLGGTRASDGMPSFQEILSTSDVQAIRAYVIARAQETAKPTQAPQRR